jgi:hypothetical protein
VLTVAACVTAVNCQCGTLYWRPEHTLAYDMAQAN